MEFYFFLNLNSAGNNYKRQVHACSELKMSMLFFTSFFLSSNTWLSRSYNMEQNSTVRNA
jgi:hypothetical protein